MNPIDNISSEEWEAIERYWQGELPPGELQAFEQRLTTDAGWKAKTEEVRLVMLGVAEENLQHSLSHFHESLPAVPASGGIVKKMTSLKWIAAACIAAVAALGIWWATGFSNQQEQLFSRYFQPDPGLPTTMGVSDNYKFDRAMVDYKTGNYTAALTAWTDLQKDNPGSDTLHYFIGAAHLAQENTAQAIIQLEPVAAQPASIFHNNACWYLALAFIKEGTLNKAIPYLKKTDHPQKEALLTALQQ